MKSAKIKNVCSKLWNSGTATSWLNLLIRPLRLFLLTPLLLTQWDSSELAVFYLVASIVGFTSLVTQFLPGIMNPVLVFFYAGVEDLSEVGKVRPKKRSPNWDGFADAFATLRRAQSAIGVVLTLLVIGLTVYAITRQVGWEQYQTNYFLVSILVGLKTLLEVLMCGIGGALRSTGVIAATNRNGAIFATLQVFASTLVVFFGGNLLLVLSVQLAVGILGQLALFRLFRKYIPSVKSGNYRKEILSHVAKPARRGLIGTMSGLGLQRLSPLLFAGLLTDKNLIAYSLCLNFVGTMMNASNSWVSSQIPRLGRLYVRGELSELGRIGIRRVMYACLMYLTLSLVGALFFFILTRSLDTPLTGLTIWYFVMFSALYLWRLILTSLMQVYDVTNERPFYLRAFISCVGALLIISFLNFHDFDSIWLPPLATVVPIMVSLELMPFRKVKALTKVRTKDVLFEGRALISDLYSKCQIR